MLHTNDIAWTGQDLLETILTSANVSSGQFGKLFTMHTGNFVFYIGFTAYTGSSTSIQTIFV